VVLHDDALYKSTFTLLYLLYYLAYSFCCGHVRLSALLVVFVNVFGKTNLIFIDPGGG